MSSADANNTQDPTERDAAGPTVLTVDEVAQVLRISRGLAFAAVRAGTIPHLRVGKRILIPRHALDAMLSAVAAPKPS